jgi:diguanylate cyclase (GGDEF)-like protein
MMSGTRLLIVDDDEDLCRALSEILGRKGYQVQTEIHADLVLDNLRQDGVDAVLLDLLMPERDGIVLLEEIKSEFEDLPIVVLTGQSDLTTAVMAMQAGASDFIAKPVEGAFLDLRIQNAVELERARHMAKLDSMTGLYNHGFFHDRLEEEIRRSQRYGRPLTLLMLDIDHFKVFNDTYGHSVGDVILKNLSKLLRVAARMEDIVARYGGEEFAVILPETGPEGAMLFADRLRKLLESKMHERAGLPPGIRITVSVGVAGWSGDGTPEDLIDAADRALYRAKKEGRNRVCVAA